MISGSIEVTVANKKIKLKLNDYNGALLINDDFFYQLFNDNNIQNEDVEDTGVDLIVSSQKDTLEIDGVSCFKQINIKTYSNTTAQFGILSVKGIQLSVVESIIDTFRTSCSSVFIANSKIDEYQYNLGNEKIDASNIGEKLELINLKINKIGVYHSIKDIMVKDAEIGKLYINSDTNEHLMVEDITISETTRVDELKVNAKVNELKIMDSKVRRFYFGRITTINQVDLNNSAVENVYFCNESKIINKEYDAWTLLFNASINDNNDRLYAKAGYMTNDLINKDRKGVLRKISNTFLKLSIGYGYKPARALSFSVINISLFALFFMISDHWFQLSQLPQVIQDNNIRVLLKNFSDLYWERWYLSGTAFTTTGFGDVSPASFGTRILTVIDALIGVSVLSLFIYSLTKRYGEKRR